MSGWLPSVPGANTVFIYYTYDKARIFSEKEAQRSKEWYDRKAKFVSLEPDDVTLVRKVTYTGKHKIQNKWEDG